jgi:hypothetical protein
VDKLKVKLKKIWLWVVAWFSPRWDLSVSYNKEWGDEDDRRYTVKKFLIKKENHLKFITHDKDVVEISSPSGLNYRITSI